MDRVEDTELARRLWRIVGLSTALGFCHVPGLEVHFTPDAWVLLTGERFPPFNTAFVGAGPDPRARLREAVDLLHGRAVPGLVFLADGVAEDLASSARALGLTPAGTTPLLVAPLARRDPVPVRELEIVRVDDPAALAAANDVASVTFGLPPDAVARLFAPPILGIPGLDVTIARLGGEVAGCVMTQRMQETVGVWNMAVVPSHQRRGIGRALLTEALERQRASGATLAYLMTSEEGRRLYERLGFRRVADVAVWTAAAGAADETRDSRLT